MFLNKEVEVLPEYCNICGSKLMTVDVLSQYYSGSTGQPVKFSFGLVCTRIPMSHTQILVQGLLGDSPAEITFMLWTLLAQERFLWRT